ncbi:MAG: choice-of-anchor D domain-containing protein [Luteolibacter sp.]
MKTSPCRSLLKVTPLAAVLAALAPASALADFSGSDSLASKSAKWDQPVANNGGGKTIFQNSRIEYTVKSPTTEDLSVFRWTPNQGSYTKNWYIQVDTHLDAVALSEGSYANMQLVVLKTGDFNKGYSFSLNRFRNTQMPSSYVTGFEGGIFESNNHAYTKNSTLNATLRVHFNSSAKTLTGSWSAGKGWKFFAPVSIAGWNMTSSDTFTAALAGDSGNDGVGANVGPVIASGKGWFTNFKAGPATPDLAVEQPTGTHLSDGRGKTNFGTILVGGSGVVKSFTVSNAGTARLVGKSITKTGANAADFTIVPPSKTNYAPGDSSTFKVTFKPKAKGMRTAVIHISTNDPTGAPFDINLTGSGK